jgi:hypothetical protein
MVTGGSMPVDVKPVKIIVTNDRGLGEMVEGYTAHWGTCPVADQFKKKKKGGKSENG